MQRNIDLLTACGIRCVIACERQDLERIHVSSEEPKVAGLYLGMTDIAEGACYPEAAYILHTSGTTGMPKGVLLPRRALEHLVEWQINESRLRLGEAPVSLQFAPYGFDVSFQEILSTLGDGGRLVVASSSERVDPKSLHALLTRERVTRAFFTPAVLQTLACSIRLEDEMPPLREVNVAGEQLVITPAIRRFFAALRGCTLVNQYGPTETHVVTAEVLDGDPSEWLEQPPLGHPLPWVNILLKGPNGPIEALGEVGEIHIGGESVAKGYIGKPELTSARFTHDSLGERFYQTGDLGCWLPGGKLSFLGRADRQVKVEGVRVEPG